MRRIGAATLLLLGASGQEAARPNIVWVCVDDMSAPFGCYGERAIATPNVDRLAAEGLKFTRAFLTATVCSPSRSALITGMYQTSIGAHHHRSGRGVLKIPLPDGVEPLPAIFRRAGYWTSIGDWAGEIRKGLGKTDYNFEWDRSIYDGNDWAGRKPGQPFFAQVMLNGGKHRHAKTWTAFAEKELGGLTDPESVVLPAHYPRDPVILADWAQYLDCARYVDKLVGRLLARLEEEKILEHTLIAFFCDNGISHARGKQFLYDEGMRTPLILRGPRIPRGAVREDLVQHIDLAAVSLASAGLSIPKGMQGRDFMAPGYAVQDAVFAARDRCDETVEELRALRTIRWKYIRNGYPKRPHLQPNRYKDGKAIVKRLKELHAEGKLDAAQSRIFAPERAPEELYDLDADPGELRNLAGEAAYRGTLEELRARLDRWRKETGDRGRESAAQYDSDMEVYLRGLRVPQEAEGLKRNIELMKRWAAEGR
jgi:arylsulfatase A-like enzyme